MADFSVVSNVALTAACTIIPPAALAAVAYLRAFTARQNQLAAVALDAAQAARVNTAVVASAQQKAGDPTLDSKKLVENALPGTKAAQAALGISDESLALRIDGQAKSMIVAPNQ